MIIRKLSQLWLITCVVFITACGGSGSSGGTDESNGGKPDTTGVNAGDEASAPAIPPVDNSVSNVPPTVSAGDDLFVIERSLVVLSALASDSDGSIRSYEWKQLNGPSVEITDSNTSEIRFQAPRVEKLKSHYLVFEVSVTDNDGASRTDVVSVRVLPTPNVLPTVDAGSDIEIRESYQVTLSAVAKDSDGSITSYVWQQVSGPTVAFSNRLKENITFKVPALENPNPLEIVFKVTVTDNDTGSSTDEVSIKVIEYKPVGLLNDSNPLGNKILESAKIGAVVGVTAKATDLTPGDTVTYEMQDSEIFQINKDSGIVTLIGGLDFSASPKENFTVIARSSDGTVTQREFEVGIISDESPRLTVNFPFNNAIFNGKTLSVRGRINDTDLERSQVMVNIGGKDIPAILYGNGEFVAKDVSVLSEAGYVHFAVKVNHSDGTFSKKELRLITNEPIWNPLNSHLDEENSRVLVLDKKLQALMSIDLETGIHHTLLKSPLIDFSAVVSSFDKQKNILYFSTYRSIFAVDITALTVTVIANEEKGSGEPLDDITDLALDSDGARLFVASKDAVIAIDLMTNQRSLISGKSVGLGKELISINSISYHNENKELYVFDNDIDFQSDEIPHLLSIDVNSNHATFGDRKIVSVGEIGGGRSSGFYGQIVQDFKNNKLLLWERSSNNTFDEVNLANGSRTTIRIRPFGDSIINVEDVRYVELDRVNNRLLGVDHRLGGLVSLDYDQTEVSLVSVVHISEGRSFNTPFDLDVDLENERYFVADIVRRSIWQVDSNTGNRKYLSFDVVNGEILNGPTGIDYAPKKNALAVAHRNSVSIIDLEREEQRVISSKEIGSGPMFSDIVDVVYDEDNDNVLALDRIRLSIFSINTITGERIELPIVGDRMGSVPGFFLDGDIALVAYSSAIESTIGGINLDTGIRVKLGISQKYIDSWAYRQQEDTAYLLNGQSLLALDLHSNQEQVISDLSISEGVGYEIRNGRGNIVWDPVTENIILATNRKVAVIDPISGDRLVISE